LLDGRLSLRSLPVFDESETARTAGLAIERTNNLRGLAHPGEVLSQVLFGGLIREIADKQSNWWHRGS
jgi:hypothetical protein